MTTTLKQPAARPVPASAAWDADLASFVTEVESLFDPERVESFLELSEQFGALANSGMASRFVQRELQRLRDNPTYLGGLRPNQIVIHRGYGYSLSLWFASSSRSYIHSNTYHGYYSPAGPDSLLYRAFAFPSNYRNQIFDKKIRLEPRGTGLVVPGGTLRVDGTREAYDFIVDQPTPVLRFLTDQFETMEWLFDKQTLQAVQANDSERSATQLRVAAYVLGRLGDRSALPALATLTEHGNHAVRWSAVQGIGRISRQAVVGPLRTFLRDAHPQIQAAAVAALRKIETES